MSSGGGGDLRSELLAAKERDLKPLLEESVDLLDLDDEQTEAMEDFLTLAWFSGTRCGHDQIEARATQTEPDLRATVISRLESEFKALMDESADTLNLTISRTITMWHFLHDAWMAGNRSCEAELLALFIERKHDIGAEALEWLAERRDSG